MLRTRVTGQKRKYVLSGALEASEPWSWKLDLLGAKCPRDLTTALRLCCSLTSRSNESQASIAADECTWISSGIGGEDSPKQPCERSRCSMTSLAEATQKLRTLRKGNGHPLRSISKAWACEPGQ